MPAEVEKMLYVGQMPWHGLGTQVEEGISVADAIVASGLDDEVEKIQLRTVDNGTDVDFYATRRQKAGNVLGFVGPDYTVLQNRDAFNWFQPFIDNGLCHIHTAGSLRDGARIWVLAKIIADPIEIVKGDSVKQFIMLSNGHDGTMSVRCGYTNIRIVCQNTLRLAHGSNGSALVRVRHSSKVKATVDNLRETMNLAQRDFEATAEQYRYLASKGCKQADMEKYFRIVLKIDADKPRKDLPTRTQNRLEDLFKLIETGKGTEIEGVKGTLWGAYNAVTESLSWFDSRSQSSRYDSLWFGPNAERNQLAFETALTLAV